MSVTPFSEYEKRFLLAEIIKNSKVPIDTLLGIIKEEQIEPNWTEIFFPPARNVKACAAAFQELLSSTPAPPLPPSGFDPTPKPSLKRRFSDTDPPSGPSRSIQPNLKPKPAANGAQLTPVPSPAETVSRKRGRPTKEVLDARRAEAAARGTVYQPLKAAGRKSTGETPAASIGFGSEGPASELGPKTGDNADSPTVKKRRGRPVKEEGEAKKVMPVAPQAVEAPKVRPEEGKDVSQQAVNKSEAVERVQEPAPPTVPSGEVSQENTSTIQSQTPAQPPSGQL